jgi:hypothetical protein
MSSVESFIKIGIVCTLYITGLCGLIIVTYTLTVYGYYTYFLMKCMNYVWFCELMTEKAF